LLLFPTGQPECKDSNQELSAVRQPISPAVLPIGLFTQKKDLLGTGWLPSSDLGAVQVDLR
jgi:hypothetical protein